MGLKSWDMVYGSFVLLEGSIEEDFNLAMLGYSSTFLLNNDSIIIFKVLMRFFSFIAL